MADKHEKSVKSAFAGLGKNNPLLQLSEAEKARLWALLKAYDLFDQERRTSRFHTRSEEDDAARAVREAAKLADKLEAKVFKGPIGRQLEPILAGYEALPAVLRAFSEQLGSVLEMAGKPGRKGEMFVNRLLVMASEFVRLKTGQPNDEHVAELVQQIMHEDNSKNATGGNGVT